MGVDIFYFVDHDLPTNSAKNFMDELNRRTGSESTWDFLYNEDAGSFENCFPNLQGDIEMTLSDADLNVELNLAKHVLMIWNLKKSWQQKLIIAGGGEWINSSPKKLNTQKNGKKK